MNNYVVYKHTDPHGLVYIGLTKRQPSRRFDFGRGYRHNRRFTEAIGRFGWDNFSHIILAEGLTREEAEALEEQYINDYKSTDPIYGYNVHSGGRYGRGMSDEGRRHLSQLMSGDNNPTCRLGHPFQGKKHTVESKHKMSVAASARTGRIVSPETRRKIQSVQVKRACVDLETGVVYESIHEAAAATGLTATKICAVCRGRRKSAGGKRWAYKNPNDNNEAL